MLPKPKKDALAIIIGKIKEKNGKSKESSEPKSESYESDESSIDEKEIAAEEALSALESKDAKSFAEAVCSLIDIHLAKSEEKEEEIESEGE